MRLERWIWNIRAGGKTPLCSSYIVIVNTNPHFLTAKMATNGDKSSKIKVASNHYWDSAMISGNHQNLTLLSSIATCHSWWTSERKQIFSLETEEEMCRVLQEVSSVSPVQFRQSSFLPRLPWTVCKQLEQLPWATQAKQKQHMPSFQLSSHPIYIRSWLL